MMVLRSGLASAAVFSVITPMPDVARMTSVVLSRLWRKLLRILSEAELQPNGHECL